MSSIPLLLSLCLLQAAAQSSSPDPDSADCADTFRTGRDNFMVDAEEAVRDGATFLSAPAAASQQACVRACCGEPNCNLVLVEREAEGGKVRTCSLFNCLHKNRFVCRFVTKTGFMSFILDSMYKKYLGSPESVAGDLAPVAMASPDVVVQPGAEVLLSGWESQALGDAHITDYSWELLSGDAAVQREKAELPDQLRLSSLQSGLYVFQLTVIDSNSQSNTAQVKVLVLSPAESDRHCLAPVKVGPCRAAFPRWFYDAHEKKCHKFSFGGCKGNRNNFLSETECEKACSGVTVPSERSSSLSTAEQCDSACVAGQFSCSSGCCVDGALECDATPQCSDESDESHCSSLNQTFARLLNIDVNEKRARCTEPPRTGPCRASHSRWYYDPLNRKCHRFTFGGCNGNDNNFLEEDACSAACQGVTERHVFARGMFERFEDEEESESGTIAIAVVLAVAILAVLAVLAYCFLKSRRDRSQRSAAAAVARGALPEEQNTLVYNSTTKPV